MPLLSDPKLVPTILPLYFLRKRTTDFQGPKRARSDEQMRNGWQFSLLNDQQMSNEVGVEHQPVFYKNMRSAIFIGSLDVFLAELHLSKGKRKKWYPSFVYNRSFIPWLFFKFCWNLQIGKIEHRNSWQKNTKHQRTQAKHVVLSSTFVMLTLSWKPKVSRQIHLDFSQGAMASAGAYHTVLLRSDGQAVACGHNIDGRCETPPLDEGLSYCEVSAGGYHTVLLRSDGQAVACGKNFDGQCSIAPLDEGLSYSQVSAGRFHSVLLRSDGQAVAFGSNSDGRCSIPPLDEWLSYSQVCAGGGHTVLLRNDGQAVACGSNSHGQCSIPHLDEGLSYCQVSAGMYHTVLLRSDGQAIACGSNYYGQCCTPRVDVSAGDCDPVLLRSDGQAVAFGSNSDERCRIPHLDEGLSYCQVSAGMYHTVLLRSDGQAVACGSNYYGQCSIPPMDEGISYIQVSAGDFHTVLLRNDGQVMACGWNEFGQCNLPSLKSWREWFGFAHPSCRYICHSNAFRMLGKDRVVQVDFLLEGDTVVILTCVGLDGLEVLRLKAQRSDRAVDVCSRVARELNTNAQNLRLVLPDRRLLASISKANPFATLSDVISAETPKWQRVFFCFFGGQRLPIHWVLVRYLYELSNYCLEV